jgi:two-component system phosphate regulon sensor histidine kinase PhoR
VDLPGLTASVVATLAPLAAQSATEIRLSLPDGPVTVSGDSGQIRQVVTNLIENAVKYGGRAGPILVTLSEPGAEPALRRPGVRLSVTDNGAGIAAHHIPRLTERFYRVDTHRSREVGGTGLGLAIVKHIVNRHRGRLRIESEVGRGSTFTVILPAD